MSKDVTIARDVNIDERGDPINWRHNERAGVLGAVMLLERIAKFDTDPLFRREARVQADFLRALIRRRSRDGYDTLDGAIQEALQALAHSRAQPKPPALTCERVGGTDDRPVFRITEG